MMNLEITNYCDVCDKDVNVIIKEENIQLQIDEIDISFIGNIPYCQECGSEVYIPSITDENIRKSNEIYREKIGIIKVFEIEELLNKYKIGQKPLAKLLGWGENTIMRYVQGLMPSREYSQRLKELLNPYNMQLLLEKQGNVLTDVARRKLEASIHEIMNASCNKKSKVMDVSRYFLGKSDIEAGELITPLKLQKLVYYAQAWFLAFFQKPLFQEDFEAWQHGPVIPSLYLFYKDFGYNPIPPVAISSDNLLTIDEKYIIDGIWEVYGKYGAKFLEKLTHSESPWINARGILGENEKSKTVISKDVIIDYYSGVKDKFSIDSIAKLNKYVCTLEV